MTPHGPDAPSYDANVKNELVPMRIPDTTLAFMFESSYLFHITPFAQALPDPDYHKCWQGLVDRSDVE